MRFYKRKQIVNYPFKNLFSSSANENLTLPAVLLAFCLSFHSVVDISDIHLVDERPAQLHPRVHHHAVAETVLRHIPHLSKRTKL